MLLDKRHILLDGASGPGCHRAVLPPPLGTKGSAPAADLPAMVMDGSLALTGVCSTTASVGVRGRDRACSRQSWSTLAPILRAVSRMRTDESRSPVNGDRVDPKC